jgi:hypothetical protein
MRKISMEKDYFQPIIILVISFFYFQIANKIRPFNYPPIVIFLVFLIVFFITIYFFYSLTQVFNKKTELKSYFFTFSYTLFPTLTWFISNSIIYFFLPPPRTMSLLGKGFSICFITFSISLLVWKIILIYLSLRFSSRLGFYRILYLILLYLIWFIPCSIFLYYLKIFRIPFI